MPNSQLPPFPSFASNEEIPDRSEYIILATSDQRLNLWANSDNSSKMEWVADVPMTRTSISPGVLVNFWEGVTPPSYTLTLRRFWLKVPGSSAAIYPGDTYSREVTKTHGFSETDSQSISAELGVEGAGLSAKITATFEHSVTVSNEVSVSQSYSVAAPDTGVRIWVLWQLVDQIAALDSSGNVISSDVFGEGDVSWFAGLPFGTTSGAFLNYPTPTMDFPSDTFKPQQVDFPT